MVCRRDTSHAHSQSRWRHLRAVQEVRTEEANGDEEIKQEDEECRRNLRRLVVLWKTGCYSEREHAGRHTGAAEHEELATAKAVDGEEGNEAREEFPSQCAAGEDT